MIGVPVGLRAVGLPWLPPSSDALLALAAEPPDPRAIARDPALLLHVLRFARPAATAEQFELTPAVLSQPSLCTSAATLLQAHGPGPTVVPDAIDSIADLASSVATDLAAQYRTCSPAAAMAVARLAPLGWYAIRAAQPAEVIACLDDPNFAGDPERVQRDRWGLSASALARRLVARWRLPAWVIDIVGFLRLDPRDAVAAGAPEGLFRVVQQACAAAERVHGILGLTDARIVDPRDVMTADATTLAEVVFRSPSAGQRATPADERDLLERLLRAAGEARRASGAIWLNEAENRVDQLAVTLEGLRAGFPTRVREARLEGLAEFAAGASHEINNPLAVIRGHAQLLLAGETDPARRRQLDSIIGQTRRVHDLLHGTLQFARPSRPVPQPVPVGDWLTECVATHQPDAADRRITLSRDVSLCGDGEVWCQFDRAQIQQALNHLIRNALEVAPPGGWVRVAARRDHGMIVISVEDSGPGPAEADVDYLFDPFFSGREAGRGRGLGLAIAWRLAQVNGGALQYAPEPGGPTRFLLSVPSTSPVSDRISA